MVKKRALYRDIFFEIRKSAGRFLSIFCITALGTAFFCGTIGVCRDNRPPRISSPLAALIVASVRVSFSFRFQHRQPHVHAR